MTPKDHDLLEVARDALGLTPIEPIEATDPEGSRAVALQFQVGLRISPFAPGVPDKIDPRTFVLHHRRGSLVHVDLSSDWRVEQEWSHPIEDVRRRLGVIDPDAVEI